MRRALIILVAAALASAAQAAIIYQCDFEDMQAPGWEIPDGREDRTALAVVGADDGAPQMDAGQRCLRMRGVAMWNICELTLDEPVALDGPVYLVADWRSHGQVGGHAGGATGSVRPRDRG
jgi:hypothetical protein